MILNDRDVTKRGKWIKRREGKEAKHVKKWLKKGGALNEVQDCIYKAYFCSQGTLGVNFLIFGNLKSRLKSSIIEF